MQDNSKKCQKLIKLPLKRKENKELYRIKFWDIKTILIEVVKINIELIFYSKYRRKG